MGLYTKDSDGHFKARGLVQINKRILDRVSAALRHHPDCGFTRIGGKYGLTDHLLREWISAQRKDGNVD